MMEWALTEAARAKAETKEYFIVIVIVNMIPARGSKEVGDMNESGGLKVER